MFFLPFARRINDRIPWVVYTLVAINVAITIHTYFGFDEERIEGIFKVGGAIPTNLTFTAAFAHMFLHAGPEHVVGNVAFLLLFGMNVERRIGPVATLALYLLSGFAALGLFVFFNPGFTAPLVGASGAVSGVIGMYLVLFRKRTVEVLWFALVVGGIIHLPSIVVASLWIGMEFLQAVFLNDKVMVAHWAHVGGFLGGLLGIIPLVRLIRVHPEIYAAQAGGPRAPERFEDLAYIPEPPPGPRSDAVSLVAAEWAPVTAAVRRLVDGVSPGSGAFATATRLAGGLARPQADDLRSRLEHAGLKSVLVAQRDEIPVAPIIMIDRMEPFPDAIDMVDQRGTARRVEAGAVVRVQAGVVRGEIPILDLVTRSPWVRYRLSGATAPKAVGPAARALRELFPDRLDRSDGATFESLGELDDHFRWKLQRPA